MNIELIIFLALWLVSTEVILFRFIRGSGPDFFAEKLISIILGLLAAFVLFGAPWSLTLGYTGESSVVGPIAYVWYYGVVLSIAAFFGINYAIHKWLERRKK